MEDILNSALALIKPSESQQKQTTLKIERFIKELSALLQKGHHSAKPILGGSFAKGTWLATEYDVDVFIQFDKPADNMSDTLEKVLPPSAVRVHGSRDYFQLEQEGVHYELVPVLNITSTDEAQNVTDCSPLHVAWVKRAPELVDDIRLTKQFLKAHRIYGAESYLQGFSGHVTDILTIHYGGFEHLLKAASNWSPKTIIDPAKHYRTNHLHYLNKSKTVGPLVVVDPLDKTRNAAAAVGEEAYTILKEAAKDFLKRPRKEAFEIHTFTPEECNADILIKITLPEGKRDIRGNKLLKTYQCISQGLSDFGIVESSWEWDGKGDAYLWYYLRDHELPAEKEQQGPPLDIDHAVKAFRNAHSNTYVKDGILYAKVPREHTLSTEALKTILSSPYVLQRTTHRTILRPTH